MQVHRDPISLRVETKYGIRSNDGRVEKDNKAQDNLKWNELSTGEIYKIMEVVGANRKSDSMGNGSAYGGGIIAGTEADSPSIVLVICAAASF